jgi:peptidoglycan/LPS O-acetylase OafA/YrhL
MRYRREIDGLRALAVLPVILFHAGFEPFGGGFVGVDVFFVISGFLITSIILEERAAGTFSLVAFYERRARRILPALFLVMAVSCVLAWMWLTPFHAREFGQSLVAVSFYGSNLLFWKKSGYFDTVAELKPLLHTWSLAVEEQFYLLFPLLVLALWRFGRRPMLAAFALLAAGSFALAQWGTFERPSTTFFLLPTRAWELLIGSFLAFAAVDGRVPRPPKPLAEALAALGVGLIAVAVLAFDKRTPFPGAYALVPTLGAALVILFATADTRVGRLLGHRLLVGIGLVSYSAYLWHQPLFAFARHRSVYEPEPITFAALAVLTLVLAALTWRYVEQPFRARGRVVRRQVFSFAAAGTTAFVALGIAAFATNGFQDRFRDFDPSAEAITMPMIDNGWCFYSVDSIRSLAIGRAGLGCHVGDRSAQRTGLLFGDSFAGHYEPFWDVVGSRLGVKVNAVTTNWCHPSAGEDFVGPRTGRSFEQCRVNRRHLLDSAGRYDFVVLAGNWGEVAGREQMDGVLDLIGTLAGRTPLVVVMAAPKQFDTDINLAFRKARFFGDRLELERFGTRRDASTDAAHRDLRALAARLPNVLFIDRDALFGGSAPSAYLSGEGVPFSLDGGHISVYGSRQAASLFLGSERYAALQSSLAAGAR